MQRRNYRYSKMSNPVSTDEVLPAVIANLLAQVSKADNENAVLKEENAKKGAIIGEKDAIIAKLEDENARLKAQLDEAIIKQNFFEYEAKLAAAALMPLPSDDEDDEEKPSVCLAAAPAPKPAFSFGVAPKK